MKKCFLFITMITIALASCKKDDNPSNPGSGTTALTITSTDFGNAGDTMLLNVDTTNLPAISLVSGQNLTWDLSTLGVDKVDTVTFLNPANTPGNTYFATTSNIAIQPEPGQPIYMYLNKTTDKVEGIGMWANVQGTEAHANYSDRPILMKFPIAYNSAYSDSSYLEAILNMQGTWIKSVMIQIINSNVDGSGTLKLPNNVSFNCLRDKRTEINKNYMYVGLTQNGPWDNPIQSSTDTNYSYSFYAKNQKWSVASINVKDFITNEIYKIEYKK